MKEQILVLFSLSINFFCQMTLKPYHIYNTLSSHYQNFWNKWFPYKISCSECKTFLLRFFIIICCKKDNRYFSDFFFHGLNLHHSFKTVHVWHLYVKQNEIRSILAKKIKKCPSGLECCNTHVILTQNMSCHFQVRHIIINNCNPWLINASPGYIVRLHKFNFICNGYVFSVISIPGTYYTTNYLRYCLLLNICEENKYLVISILHNKITLSEMTLDM